VRGGGQNLRFLANNSLYLSNGASSNSFIWVTEGGDPLVQLTGAA